MRISHPTDGDVSDIDIAIQSFDGAWGSVDPAGVFKPGIDPRITWMMIPMESIDMVPIWRFAGLNTGPESSFQEMLDATDNVVHVRLFRVKRLFHKNLWIGNISLNFAGGEVEIGSVAGRVQSELWGNFRAVLECRKGLFESTVDALGAA